MAPAPVEAIPTAEAVSATAADPHALAAAMGRLGGGSRRNGSAAALVAAGTLQADETVELVIAGRFRGHDGVGVLTGRRLLLVNARQWSPEVVEVADLHGAEVEGWIERRAATVRITAAGEVHVMDRIPDTGVAEQFTAAVRSR